GTIAACGGGIDNGYAVDLTIVIDPAVNLDLLRTIDVAVSGAESATRSFDVAGKLTGRQATVIYRPAVAGGDLRFAGTGLDASHRAIGYGTVEVTLTPGKTVLATLTLTSDVPAMPDLIMSDMTVGTGRDLMPPAEMGGAACRNGV